MSDNPLASSFMMLTNRLYNLFVQYILENRTRAPPEYELGEMLPTFQFGAKTDRRALQSKFKCWAKRMKFENGYLVLGNSGKIIVPRDKCDDIIMSLHSEKHNTVENVILQIQMRYSWTKKNFGMDRDLVVQSIAKNCKIKGCLEEMRMELSRLNSNFSKVTKSSPSLVPFPIFATESDFDISTSMPHSSYLCRWPLPFPVAPMFSSSAMSFGAPFWNCSVTPITSAIPSFFSNGSMPTEHNGSDTDRIASSPKFRQPTNTLEYETLMKVVRQNPNMFPKILANKKNLFLSNFGIAPKCICSLPTLKRFLEEVNYKKYLNRYRMVYKDCKILRDRSKLKKFSQERRPYLEMPKNKDRISSRVSKIANMRLPSEKLHTSDLYRNLNNGRRFDGNIQRKMIKSRIITKNKQFEVIDIASSSDEEERKENLPPNKASEIESVQANAKGNAVISDSNDEQNFNAYIKDSPSSEKNQIHQHSKVDGCSVKPTICYPIPLVHSVPLKLYPSNNLYSTSVSQSKADKYAFKNKNVFNIPKTENKQTLNIVKPYILPRAKFTGKYPIALHLRQKTPSIEKMHPYFALSNQNAPRFVYPVPIPKMESKIKQCSTVKGQSRRIFAAPLFPNFTHNSSCRTKPETTPSSVSTAVPCTLSTVSQLIQTSRSSHEAQHQTQTNVTLKNKSKDGESKPTIDEEMMRISKWIYRMKSILNPTMFHNAVEKSVQKLISQLDYGIQLVREARKCLSEVEDEAEFKEFISENINDLL